MSEAKSFCRTYKCTVTPKFCESRRKKDDIYCLPCNPQSFVTRKIQKIESRQNSSQFTIYRKIATKILHLKVGENMLIKVTGKDFRTQQCTISNIGVEFNRRYKTSNLRNGNMFITRVE